MKKKNRRQKKLKLPIYLDNNATTAVDPEVLEAMLPFYREHFGNSASRSHKFGYTAEKAISDARRQVADLIGGGDKEIVWTSGATESDNLAIKGVAKKYRDKGNHIITCLTEHKAVLDSCKYLQQQGYEVTYLPVDKYGMIDLGQLRDAIKAETILISLMAANNETGVLHPIEEIGDLARERGVLFHCDATQGVGKIPIDVKAMKIDLLSMTAHKIYGPKGVGVLYVSQQNPQVRLEPIIHGGGQEQGMRSGTLNTPGIVGMGKACLVCGETMASEKQRLKKLADKLYNSITQQIDMVSLNGHPQKRLVSVLNLGIAYVESEFMMLAMPDVAVASGSACTSVTLESSHVLKAMAVGIETINGSLRFSLGRFNTEEEIDYAVQCVVQAILKGRKLSPLYEQATSGT